MKTHLLAPVVMDLQKKESGRILNNNNNNNNNANRKLAALCISQKK